MTPLLICVCFLSSILPTNALLLKKTWDYTILSFNSTSEDDSIIKWNVKIDRIDRGSFAMSGTILLHVGDGADYYVTLQSYRSASGNNNYQLLPFKLPKQSVKYYMETSHKNYFMESFAGCSDLPQSKGKMPPMLENKTYTLNKCKVSTEHFPSHLIPGFYKVVFIGTGPVGYTTEFIIHIETKL